MTNWWPKFDNKIVASAGGCLAPHLVGCLSVSRLIVCNGIIVECSCLFAAAFISTRVNTITHLNHTDTINITLINTPSCNTPVSPLPPAALALGNDYEGHIKDLDMYY